MPTGGIVAAPTTSLPEFLGGVRNWDYRYCWLRDASLTLDALMAAGYVSEALGWRDWLIRAVAGDPEDLQIMYGVSGERRLDEYQLDWLSGYEGSVPVRVGNAASGQRQLDVYGETIDALYRARKLGMPSERHAWAIQGQVLDWLESHWREPDDGLWEVRGPRRNFVHSKVMAWVAVDRIVRSIEETGLDGPVDRYRKMRVRHPRRGLPGGIRRRAQHLHAVLRLSAARRRAPPHSSGRVPAADRPACRGHRGGGAAGAAPRWVRHALHPR